MSTIAFEYNSAIVGSFARLISGPFRGVARFAANYVARSRAERALAALDDRLLQDIGLARHEIHDKVWG